MKCWSAGLLSLLFLGGGAQGQQQPETVPIYRVTVVGRTIKALNYGHREAPTKIGFQGTVLLPESKGEAIVEPRRGSVQIDAKFEKVPPPTRFGHQYLTYVVWAITPEGRSVNLGELVLDHANKGKLRVTTDFQAFGLLVTAEPYYSVTVPSDVVVMENVVRGDTTGQVQEIEAKTDLLQRGAPYTLVKPARAEETGGKKLSLDRYEATLALYQAQNALQIAKSAGADRYAADTFRKAQERLQEAESQQAQNGPARSVVTAAREAAQAAEDARAITAKRQEEEREANERKQAAEREGRAKAEAEAAAQQASREAEESARQRPPEQTAVTEPPPAPVPVEELRSRLAQELNAILETRATNQGLVMTLLDDQFEGGRSTLRPAAREKLAKVSGVVVARPGLQIEVEGYTSGLSDHQLMSQRAAAVRDYLVAQGVAASSVSARGFSMRPSVSAGWQPARRVELVITGAPIGVVNVSRLGREQ